jgi:hypothetical protein
MKLGALVLVLLTLSLIATIALLSYAIYTAERTFSLGALSSFGVTLFLFIIYRVYASSAHCPLCRGSVLGGSSAQRNRRAKRTFGSHRLRVARNIIFTNSFTCPYCNESTKCVVKERPRGGQIVKHRSANRR